MIWAMRASAYCTLATLLLTGPPAAAQQPIEVTPGTATFNVFVRSTPIGFEQIEVLRGPNGWIIRSRGDLSQPIDLQNRLFEVEYDEQWRPQTLTIDAVRANTPFSIRTTFDANGATTELEEAGRRFSVTSPVPPDAVVLPDYFFAAYEALAIRLAGAERGDEIPVYVVPRGVTRIRVDQILTQQIDTGSEIFDARVYRLSFLNADGPLTVEVWTDPNHRLVRVSIPFAAIDVAREDIVSSGARVRRVPHPGDEDIQIRAEGFGLAATVTTPVDRPRPSAGWPAVLLVPGAGAGDRDGTLSGVPVLGQIAGALADAGFLVARYDARGEGQSGGRRESADVEAYTDDARKMVRYLDDRDDVDRDRITVLGYAEGGWIAMVVAAKERRADNLVLVGTPGTTGVELVMEQQRAVLDRLGLSETERAEKIDLQQRIHDAVLSNGSWDGVPEAMRRQADTPWFRDFLDFDPADTIRRTRQPILILRGALDSEVGPHHAERLAELAQARRRNRSVVLVTLEGLDHQLVATEPGAVTDYDDLRNRSISPSFINALTDWLHRAP
ncbi:MAG: alpha/beta fold hydrolase [Acidobacteria bacterium]|nr:MAG: alpha/beta fold hydrolase [Acidobacteriota bacterium]